MGVIISLPNITTQVFCHATDGPWSGWTTYGGGLTLA